jgi:hypothetical protein
MALFAIDVNKTVPLESGLTAAVTDKLVGATWVFPPPDELFFLQLAASVNNAKENRVILKLLIFDF